MAGVFGLLTILHLVLSRYNPAQRANLYFALYALCLALDCLSIYYNETLDLPTLGAQVVLGIIAFALLFLSSLSAVRALYALFNFRPGWLYAGPCGSCGGLLLYCALNIFGAGNFAYLPFIALATAERLRLTGRALGQRQRGAWIMS